ncbi:hypothetical protein ACJIZ3_007989 [Penstemon smallii]|uniref:Uncharacterized protein n=1 Tax=Penstemon smallii TaxID=265156 RepID=A0ABD3TAG1_9LAMI
MKSVVISMENVQPSYPTPLHLRNYKLSMLDQIVPPMLVPVILYFSPSTNINIVDPEIFLSQATDSLKRSLSLILTRFYPIAGKISGDGLSIDCNDQGVPFYVAKITGHKLSDLLKNPDPQFSKRLVPCEVTLDFELGPGGNLAMIQVNHFECGGIAIGAVFWHKVADAMTIGTFLNAWAVAARAESSEPICPNYISQLLFPQKEEMQNQTGSLGSLFNKGKALMRRYVFDASAIGKLKAESNIKRPTRVEVVSAHLWKCFMVASLLNGKSASLVTQAVNLRRRAKPSFPSDCFGNFPGLAAASSTNENKKELGHLVKEMRDALNTIDHDFVNRMLGDEGFLGYTENQQRTWSKIPDGADLLAISSWCSFGLYNVDFGWGKPIWLTRCDVGSDSESSFLNGVWLMDTRSGDGVEAWVTLDEKYMKIFENVEELKAYTSKDPSPLD